MVSTPPAAFAPLPTYFPKDDLVFKYGWYCGKENYRHDDCNGPRPEPLDCIDRACQAHDDCLEAATDYWGGGIAYWSVQGAICNCKLFAAATACVLGGCLFGNRRGILGVSPCVAAAGSVQVAFAALCLASGISATVIGQYPKSRGEMIPPYGPRLR